MENNKPWEKAEISESLWISLRNKYVDFQESTIFTLIHKCKTADVDPLSDCYYLIKRGKKESVEQGIALFRIQAARTGLYIELSEPEFGPDITKSYQMPYKDWNSGTSKEKTISVTYPQWCKIHVIKFNPTANEKGNFYAYEFWEENYATISNNNNCPNAMWQGRPSGQLAKCTEAQALRKAFPDVCKGYTYEEMEGKYDDDIEIKPGNSRAISIDNHTYKLDDKFFPRGEVLAELQSHMIKISSNNDMSHYEQWKLDNEKEIKRWMHNHKNKPELMDYKASYESIKIRLMEHDKELEKMRQNHIDNAPMDCIDSLYEDTLDEAS